MITVAEARTFLKLPSTEDAFLERQILYATAFLGRSLNRYLGAPATQIEIKNGGPKPGFETLVLDERPSAEPDLLVWTRTTRAEAWVAVDPEDFELDGAFLTHLTAWPYGTRNIKVSYQAGYAVGTGPDELRQLVRDLVAIKVAQRPQDGMADGMQSETIGDYSYTRNDLDRLDGWSMVALKWRRPVV